MFGLQRGADGSEQLPHGVPGAIRSLQGAELLLFVHLCGHIRMLRTVTVELLGRVPTARRRLAAIASGGWPCLFISWH